MTKKRIIWIVVALGFLATSGLSAQGISRNTYQKTEIKMAKKGKNKHKLIENGIVAGYKLIEKGVVSGYKKVEDGVVSGYKKIEDQCVDHLFRKEDETIEEAKMRLKNGLNTENNKEF